MGKFKSPIVFFKISVCGRTRKTYSNLFVLFIISLPPFAKKQPTLKILKPSSVKIKTKRKLITYLNILDQPLKFNPFVFSRTFFLWALLGTEVTVTAIATILRVKMAHKIQGRSLNSRRNFQGSQKINIRLKDG